MADGTVKEIEVPYDIPDSWEWVRLENISKLINDGTHSTPHYTERGVPFLSVKNMSSGFLNFSNTKYISLQEHRLLSQRAKPERDDILLSKVGTTGIPVKVDTNLEFSIFVSLALIKLLPLVEPDFIVYLIKAPVIFEQSKEGTRGVGNKNLVLQTIKKFLIPLPPLSEQQRIVEQIERTLEKVDAYSESYNKLQELDKSFPGKLKKSILQYAMQGKLVPQDPNDESVEVLLEKIQAEKQKLYEEGKLKKKDLGELVVSQEDDSSPYKEVPYNIPKSWEWVRLGNISSLNFFSSISGDKIPNDSWVLDMEDIEKETGRLVRKNYKTGKSSYKSNKISFSKDTILYAKLRPNLKKVIISDENGFATTELIPIKVFGNISLEYIRYCMISPFYYFNIIQSVYGVKMPRVSSGFLNSTLLPLPPLAEQQRIVSKISQVFLIIESLV